MTEKELALYIRRLTAHLQTICDQLSDALPDAERKETTRKQLKQGIKKQVEEWKKEHPFSLSEFFGDIPKEFDQPDNFEEITEYGIIKALEPLYNMIDELNDDVSLIMPSEE